MGYNWSPIVWPQSAFFFVYCDLFAIWILIFISSPFISSPSPLNDMRPFTCDLLQPTDLYNRFKSRCFDEASTVSIRHTGYLDFSGMLSGAFQMVANISILRKSGRIEWNWKRATFAATLLRRSFKVLFETDALGPLKAANNSRLEPDTSVRLGGSHWMIAICLHKLSISFWS